MATNRDCLIETALAEETRLEAKLLNDTEIELYKVSVPLRWNSFICYISGNVLILILHL